MTNSEKYLKDGVDVDNLCLEIATEYARVSAVDWYQNIGGAIKRFFEKQVKPTLSEDEKFILKNIKQRDEGWFPVNIGRKEGWLYITFYSKYIEDYYKEYHISWLYEHLFQCIKERRRI